MEINPIAPADRQYIQRYDASGFRVSGVDHVGSVIVLPARTLAWAVSGVEAIDASSLDPVFGSEPPIELLLIGCGRRGAMIPPALRQALRARGIGLEAMDTGAACRTYNVLVNDARRVAAALIAPGP